MAGWMGDQWGSREASPLGLLSSPLFLLGFGGRGSAAAALLFIPASDLPLHPGSSISGVPKPGCCDVNAQIWTQDAARETQ